jgi:hypothetical protein
MNKLRGSSKADVMKRMNIKASESNNSLSNTGEVKLVAATNNSNKSNRRGKMRNTKAKKVCKRVALF